jgi:hypothetical protein
LDDWFNGISFAVLHAQFQDIVDRGHQVLVLINACYGVDFHRGLAFGGDGDPPIAPKPTREGAHAITAGGTGEVTWHDPNFPDSIGPKGSVFFEAVLAALDGRADKLPEDGIVSVGELQAYLHGTVSRFTDEHQNPTASDMKAATSPGGFFFLDHRRQMEEGNAEPLTGTWWSGISFGGPSDPSDQHEQPRPDPNATPSPDAVASSDDAGSDRNQAFSDPLWLVAPLPAMEGRWVGTAQAPNGFSFDVEVELGPNCGTTSGYCGTIAVPYVPCRGKIKLFRIHDGPSFEFDVGDFDATSDKNNCSPGAGEILKPLPDGTLSYTAEYSGATGILRRRNF